MAQSYLTVIADNLFTYGDVTSVKEATSNALNKPSLKNQIQPPPSNQTDDS